MTTNPDSRPFRCPGCGARMATGLKGHGGDLDSISTNDGISYICESKFLPTGRFARSRDCLEAEIAVLRRHR